MYVLDYHLPSMNFPFQGTIPCDLYFADMYFPDFIYQKWLQYSCIIWHYMGTNFT